MWIYDYLPLWTLILLLAAAGCGFLLTYTRLLWISKLPTRYICAAVLVTAVYMLGAAHMNNHWHQRASELQQKVEELQAKSQAANTEVATKIQQRNVVIAQNTSETIKYIDREITKFDSSCVLPPELIEVHNKAAKQ